MNKKILELKNITKSFEDNKVLQNVSFELFSGEIHSLIGENGAGKTTLIKILTGIVRPDEGRIIFNKEDITRKSINYRIKSGISTVYQELDLCSNLTVAENIFLGESGSIFISSKKQNQQARELLSELGLDIDVTKKLEEFSVGIRQIIAIARAIRLNPKILILDEPTSSLTLEDTKRLFEVVVNLKEKGVGIIFITHFLHQVYELCDRVTILRDGNVCGTYSASELHEFDLVKLMLGRDVEQLPESHIKVDQKEYINYEDVNSNLVKNFNLKIGKGEIVGLAGMISSGVSEIAELLYGIDLYGGTVTMDGTVLKNDMYSFINDGISFLSKDRKDLGIISGLSIYDNMILLLQQKNVSKKLKKKEMLPLCNNLIKKLNIKVHNINDNIEKLSGGNQQKVLLSRLLLANPKLLILEEPTRGIDISSKINIWNFIVELAKEGMSIIIVSSEIEELMRLCNRILVVNNYNVVMECDDDYNQDIIISSMLGDIDEE